MEKIKLNENNKKFIKDLAISEGEKESDIINKIISEYIMKTKKYNFQNDIILK